MPASTSRVMASILARQFVKLQAPPCSGREGGEVPPSLRSKPVSSPLILEAWRRALRSHPAKDFVRDLLKGIEFGFRIGLRSPPPNHQVSSNCPSAQEHSAVISDYIRSQVERGFMAGPFPPQTCTGIVCSRMVVIPKKTPGKWRVIVDLSHPGDRSVNHLIRREATHVAYSSTGDAAHLMHFLGRNTLMAKLDIKEAYRIVPIHPDDRRFLGVCWQGQVYVDCQLPFGLASAPVIFSALGEALEWILRQRGVKAVIHYIDDFLLLGPPSSPECKEALAITLQTCQELGVPIAPEKTEGPGTSITFLGIQLDSTSMTVSLPQDKLTKLQAMVRAACKLKSVNDVHFLESLVGHLVHATTVCPLAKAFLHHLFTLKAALKPGQTRRLNLSARTDLAWWDALLESWPGISVQQFLILRQPDFHLFCDASETWGCGAWCIPHWLQVPWSDLPPHSTALQELFPVVVAAAVWGAGWTGRLVLCHSDNAPVVAQVNRLHAHDPLAAHLLRCLALFQALHDFRLRAVYVPGSANSGADHLSRNQAAAFLHSHSNSSPVPSRVPSSLICLLSSQPPQGTLHLWRELFSNFWRAESPQIQERPTCPAGTSTSRSLHHTPSRFSPYPQKR